LNIILAPDVYVNASVALGSPPEQVVRRVLGKGKGASKSSEWILTRVRSMLGSLPAFKSDALNAQMDLIRGLVQVATVTDDFGPDAWKEALIASAKAADAARVITDHPDLLALETADGVEFISTEAWLLEAATPPPAPPPKPK
jgi:hypothetical protein